MRLKTADGLRAVAHAPSRAVADAPSATPSTEDDDSVRRESRPGEGARDAAREGAGATRGISSAHAPISLHHFLTKNSQ